MVYPRIIACGIASGNPFKRLYLRRRGFSSAWATYTSFKATGRAAGQEASKPVVECTCKLKLYNITKPYFYTVGKQSPYRCYGYSAPARRYIPIIDGGARTRMEEFYGFSRGTAFLLLGQVLEARCTTIVNHIFSYVAKIVRKYLSQRVP
jgi:hypothetical protein